MIGRKLAYIALIVSDVEATAVTLTRDFGLRRTNCAVGDSQRTVPVFGIGATAVALFPPADPFVSHEAKTGVHHMAFEVGDLTVAAATAASAGVPAAENESTKGLGGARRLMLSPQATVGVKTYLSEPLSVEPSRGGWVERIDHLGVAGADNDAAMDVFGRRLGCPLESTQTDMEVHIAVESFTSDKYGVVYHTRAPEPRAAVAGWAAPPPQRVPGPGHPEARSWPTGPSLWRHPARVGDSPPPRADQPRPRPPPREPPAPRWPPA
jgi:hypothetical protein